MRAYLIHCWTMYALLRNVSTYRLETGVVTLDGTGDAHPIGGGAGALRST